MASAVPRQPGSAEARSARTRMEPAKCHLPSQTNIFTNGGWTVLGVLIYIGFSITPKPGIGFIDYYILVSTHPARPARGMGGAAIRVAVSLPNFTGPRHKQDKLSPRRPKKLSISDFKVRRAQLRRSPAYPTRLVFVPTFQQGRR